MSNIEFLVSYLTRNPGSSAAQARRALADHKRKAWGRGLYCWYFARGRAPSGSSKLGADYGYWKKMGHGWVVTEKGTKLLK